MQKLVGLFVLALVAIASFGCMDLMHPQGKQTTIEYHAPGVTRTISDDNSHHSDITNIDPTQGGGMMVGGYGGPVGASPEWYDPPVYNPPPQTCSQLRDVAGNIIVQSCDPGTVFYTEVGQSFDPGDTPNGRLEQRVQRVENHDSVQDRQIVNQIRWAQARECREHGRNCNKR